MEAVGWGWGTLEGLIEMGSHQKGTGVPASLVESESRSVVFRPLQPHGLYSQSCPILCSPMDYTVQGILQARILEWVAFPFSRGSSQPRD